MGTWSRRGSGGGGRRRPGSRDDAPWDIVTPTEGEARDADIARRRRRYFLIMVPCIAALVLFGFVDALPTSLRVAVLSVAAVMPPVAAFVGSRRT